ncbi:hypothetical protein CPB85DRAFT_1432438 [Mucidula mucida]|nr:hypothetical protein CPB85DRAFT_1432438 [Mucidula mucida]
MSGETTSSNLPAPTASAYTPDEFESEHYYNGMNGDRPHAKLVYGSDHEIPFPRTHLPVRTLHPGGSKTALRDVWNTTLGRQVSDILSARNINWSSIAFPPMYRRRRISTTSADAAHEAIQEILTLLREKEIDDVGVEYRESVVGHKL